MHTLKWNSKRHTYKKPVSESPNASREAQAGMENHPKAEQSAVAMLPVPWSEASHAVSVDMPNIALISNLHAVRPNPGQGRP